MTDGLGMDMYAMNSTSNIKKKYMSYAVDSTLGRSWSLIFKNRIELFHFTM